MLYKNINIKINTSLVVNNRLVIANAMVGKRRTRTLELMDRDDCSAIGKQGRVITTAYALSSAHKWMGYSG